MKGTAIWAGVVADLQRGVRLRAGALAARLRIDILVLDGGSVRGLVLQDASHIAQQAHCACILVRNRTLVNQSFSGSIWTELAGARKWRK